MTEVPKGGLTVEVTLSRPAFRLGNIITGTVRIAHATGRDISGNVCLGDVVPARKVIDGTPSAGDRSSAPFDVRAGIESLQVSLAGYCRLDPRWHNVEQTLQAASRNRYATSSSIMACDNVGKDLPENENSFCFWSTSATEMLMISYREKGRWEDWKPKPIIVSGLTPSEQQPRAGLAVRDGSRVDVGGEIYEVHEEDQLAWTFRICLLNAAMPFTITTSSCRYYYEVTVRVQRSILPTVHWVQVPVQILAPNPNFRQISEKEVGDCYDERNQLIIKVMAHSDGLPGALSATETHQYTGQLSVHRHGTAVYRHMRDRLHHDETSHLQCMKVTDPVTNSFVCLLTLMGAGVLQPGSRLILKLDVPVLAEKGSFLHHFCVNEQSKSDPSSSDETWIPAFQASAYLEGEEWAIQPDGSRRRARRTFWDTAHKIIDPNCAETICLDLTLPMHAPCSLKTSVLEITTKCFLDITIASVNGSGYRDLRLEMPCQVHHGLVSWESSEIEEQVLTGNKRTSSQGEDKPGEFFIDDVQLEIKALSIAMAKRRGLLPTKPTIS